MCQQHPNLFWIYFYISVSCCSVAKSHPTLCDPLDCSTLGFPILPRACSNSCPLSPWCHPIILPSVGLFSSCPKSCPASGVFPMSQLFASGGQSIGASASVSVLPMNIQDWFPLGLTGLISLQSRKLSRVLFSTTDQKHQFFSSQPSLWSNSHIWHMTPGKNIALTIWTFVGKVICLLFNMLSRFVIAILPRSRHHH